MHECSPLSLTADNRLSLSTKTTTSILTPINTFIEELFQTWLSVNVINHM